MMAAVEGVDSIVACEEFRFVLILNYCSKLQWRSKLRKQRGTVAKTSSTLSSFSLNPTSTTPNLSRKRLTPTLNHQSFNLGIFGPLESVNRHQANDFLNLKK